MNSEVKKPNKISAKLLVVCILIGILLLSSGIGIGYLIRPAAELPEQTENKGYAANPAYEHLAGAAAWQMSAEAHALMMQAFHLARRNIDDMIALADAEQEGYRWVTEDGEKKLFLNDKRVAVVCDIDDTLVDGVHYSANIIGKNGEWSNKTFVDFILSEGYTSLPGAVAFADHCVDNGIALFYVTNRYDRGYKTTDEDYGGEEGYKKPDGTVLGSSVHDIFGKTVYDITMESMARLGFPTNDPENSNYSKNAVLIVNDSKLNGSDKEWIRNSIAEGGSIPTGERAEESDAYPHTVDLSAHHIAMLMGDDLNDISDIFSKSESAVDRVALSIENIDKWGAEWIVFPDAVYGSASDFAMKYGISNLFEYFDYIFGDEAWEMYK